MPSNVLVFPRRHLFYKCDGDHPDGRPCMYCDGGLSHCTVCGGGEGSLPEHCPGVRMTDEQERAVYAGDLDYRAKHGGWTDWSRDKENAVRARLNGQEWHG